MFGKRYEVPLICKQFDDKVLDLMHARHTIEGWAQAVKWFALPMEVLIKDTPEYLAAKADMQETQLNLRLAMGSYDTDRQEFINWKAIHQEDLPPAYQNYGDPVTSLDAVRCALEDINKDGYSSYKRYIRKKFK